MRGQLQGAAASENGTLASNLRDTGIRARCSNKAGLRIFFASVSDPFNNLVGTSSGTNFCRLPRTY
jgi:hypothetical protein